VDSPRCKFCICFFLRWNIMHELVLTTSCNAKALLERDTGIQAVKQRGLQVLRVRVTAVSRLVGKTAADSNFRDTYKAAIVAMQRGGKNVNQALSTAVFQPQDILILQVSDDSPLLRVKPPTEDFYKKLAEEANPKPKSFVILTKLPNLTLGSDTSTQDERKLGESEGIVIPAEVKDGGIEVTPTLPEEVGSLPMVGA
jgi:TrkA-C domain